MRKYMKYKHPRESEKISEVLAVLFDEPKRVPEITDSLGKSESTVYKRLNALKQEKLVEEEDHKYRPNKDLIFGEFWTEIVQNLTFEQEETHRQFNSIKEKIRENKEFKTHLLNFVKYELKSDNTPLREIFAKYKDRLEIRYNYFYILANNHITSEKVSEEKKMFWKYLQIVQAFLPHSVWTETGHRTKIELQMQPTKIENLGEAWKKLKQKARENLDELTDQNN